MENGFRKKYSENMTEEQIKQNALAYAIENYGEYDEHDYTDHSGINMCHAVSEKAFIAGAHSRDEEIKRLYNSLEHFRDIINNLRHPWISVEEKLPEKGQKILVSFRSGAMICDECFNEHEVNLFNVTHWMPIPEIKKGE